MLQSNFELKFFGDEFMVFNHQLKSVEMLINEKSIQFLELLNNFSEELYETYMLHFEGFKNYEIAKNLNISIESVESRLNCVRNILLSLNKVNYLK